MTQPARVERIRTHWIAAIPDMKAGSLRPREAQAMRLYADGNYPLKIGKILGITTNTAQVHLQRAKQRLGARSLVHAAVLFDRLMR